MRRKKDSLREIVERVLRLPEEEKLKRADEAIRVFAERRKRTHTETP